MVDYNVKMVASAKLIHDAFTIYDNILITLSSLNFGLSMVTISYVMAAGRCYSSDGLTKESYAFYWLCFMLQELTGFCRFEKKEKSCYQHFVCLVWRGHIG